MRLAALALCCLLLPAGAASAQVAPQTLQNQAVGVVRPGVTAPAIDETRLLRSQVEDLTRRIKALETRVAEQDQQIANLNDRTSAPKGYHGMWITKSNLGQVEGSALMHFWVR